MNEIKKMIKDHLVATDEEIESIAEDIEQLRNDIYCIRMADTNLNCFTSDLIINKIIGYLVK